MQIKFYLSTKLLFYIKNFNRILIYVFQTIVFKVRKGPFQEEFYQCVTHGFYQTKWQEFLYGAFSLITVFILPLLLLLATYAATFITLYSEYLTHFLTLYSKYLAYYVTLPINY